MNAQNEIRRYFGTDGIRGRVGEPPITPDFVLRLGWAAGKVFARQGVPRILIGKDTRISGYMLESALEAGMSAAGVDVQLTGPMPTPGIAYLTRTFRCDAGVVISASHNPYYDNGIKFFSPAGNKLADEIETAIEGELDGPMTTVDSAALGKASRVDDAAGRYIEFCKATVRSGFRIPGLRIVLDCANGATYDVAPAVFRELGAQVIEVATDPDGLNINAGCGSTDTEELVRKVRETEADLGIAFDGDGDRVIMVDDRGEVVDGDQILYIIARQRRRCGNLLGGVVGTLMSNLGLERALEGLEIPFVRTQVGDRFVLAELESRDWVLGGEASGHVVCRDVHTTGDGIISALQVLCALELEGQTLRDAVGGLERFPQAMVNVRVPDPRGVIEAEAVASAVARVERHLGARGRVLLRPSGTEPVVRVMVEGEDLGEIDTLAGELAEDVRTALGCKPGQY